MALTSAMNLFKTVRKWESSVCSSRSSESNSHAPSRSERALVFIQTPLR